MWENPLVKHYLKTILSDMFKKNILSVEVFCRSYSFYASVNRDRAARSESNCFRLRQKLRATCTAYFFYISCWRFTAAAAGDSEVKAAASGCWLPLHQSQLMHFIACAVYAGVSAITHPLSSINVSARFYLYEAAVPQPGMDLEDSLTREAMEGTLEQDTACRPQETILGKKNKQKNNDNVFGLNWTQAWTE